MANLKVYKKGNYIIVEDSFNKYWEEIALNVKISKLKTDSTEFTINFKDVKEKWENIPFANILQENGTPYADQATFETWYTDNTGFNAATKESVAAVTASLSGKQDLLVSGDNLKTVNGNSLLGPGDLVISGTSNYIAHEVKLGEAINKGQAAYVSGADGTNMIVSLADNSTEALSSKTLGLIETSGATNDFVNLVTEGLLSGFDTSAATIGDSVWLGTSGNLLYGIANKPVTPNHLVFIGIVTRVHATQGEVFVKVQNGFELDELHDVLITSVADGEILSYDSVLGLWKNTTPSAGGGSTGTETNATRSLPYTMGSGVTTYKAFMPMSSTTISSLAFSGETVHFFPASLKEGNTVSSLAFRVYTAGSAGFGTAHVEFAIYNATTDGSGNLIPGTLEVSFGKVATNTTGVKEATLVSPHTLGATTDGIYFIAFRNYSTSSIQLNIHSTSDSSTFWFGFSSSTSVVKLGSFYATCAYTEPDGMPTALPATGGVGFTPSATVAGYITSRVLAGIR